jgi:hypothetical protein
MVIAKPIFFMWFLKIFTSCCMGSLVFYAHLMKESFTVSESRHAHIPLHWYIYPLIPVLIWAVNMVVTRYAASVIEPVSISFWRLLIAWLLMSPWMLPAVIKDKQQISPTLVATFNIGFSGDGGLSVPVLSGRAQYHSHQYKHY